MTILQSALTETKPAQPVLPLMHWWFLIDMGLVTIAGVQLFLLGERTDQFFAWTIKFALTAAFLGASYLCTLPMLFTSFRAREWADARVAVPGVWIFTLLTAIATFQHWDKFHWNSPSLTAQFAFWVWLVVYLVVPIGLGIVWYKQQRVPGIEPVPKPGMPMWFRLLLGAQTVLVLLIGVALYVFPGSIMPLWMWALTPLTGAAIGAWLIGIGVTLVWAIKEREWQRLRGVMPTYALFGVLQLVAVARYSGEIDWNNMTAWLYITFLMSVLVLGALGTLLTRRVLWVSNKELRPPEKEAIESQNREALSALRAKLSSLSEDEWRILEMVKQSGGIGIHVESMYEELWLGPAYISDVLRVLERDGLVKIDRGYNYLSEDIRELLRGYGDIKLRDLLDTR